MADWMKKPVFRAGPPRRWYWGAWMLFGFVIAIFEFAKAWKYIHKRAAILCILISFFLMQMLEGFATLKGIWVWNDNTIWFKIGNIPASEWGVYIMAPMVAVGTIEYAGMLLKKMYLKNAPAEGDK